VERVVAAMRRRAGPKYSGECYRSWIQRREELSYQEFRTHIESFVNEVWEADFDWLAKSQIAKVSVVASSEAKTNAELAGLFAKYCMHLSLR
jgi:hypothetical protein